MKNTAPLPVTESVTHTGGRTITQLTRAIILAGMGCIGSVNTVNSATYLPLVSSDTSSEVSLDHSREIEKDGTLQTSQGYTWRDSGETTHTQLPVHPDIHSTTNPSQEISSIPETSAALLGGLGLITLLKRRRDREK